jgi:hypothetical protein
MTYYLLWVSQGEYSDRSEWPVALYESKADAEAAVLRGGAIWREICGSDGFVAYAREKAVKASPLYRELAALAGAEISLYDDPTFYCCELEMRPASGMEAEGQDPQGLGAEHDSPAPKGDAQ